uniref:DNA-damage-repair/toleration protein DRT100 n=1 Tax=Anthurium amnicola TaxID=1678845 RepID=A0A1D1YPM0_9ARAE
MPSRCVATGTWQAHLMASRPFHSFLLLLLFFSHHCIITLAAQQVLPPTRLSPVDVAVLSDVRRSLRDHPGSDFFSTWRLLDSPSAAARACSTFAGVVCSSPSPDTNADVRVTSLTLGPGLAGTLPSTLANLTMLAQLVLPPGRVSGQIPSALALPALRLLSLSGNLLSGPIPASFADAGALPSLHTLDLGHNRLSGAVPSGLLALPSLRVLVLAGNGGLGGWIPPVAAPLLHLDLRQNNLTGRLPRPLPQTLRYLSVSGNAMWGPVEALDAAFPDLAFLDISANAFSGPIPASLFAPRSPPEEEVPPPPAMLLLQRNNLSGPIPSPPEPAAVARWTVDLSHNRLTGPLPAGLAAAGILFVNHNRLTGAVPSEFARSVYTGTMTTLYAQHNYLTGFDFPLPLPGAPTTPPLPEGVTVCLSYNCMVPPPPVGPPACPAGAGGEGSRPPFQCPAFHNHTATAVAGVTEP